MKINFKFFGHLLTTSLIVAIIFFFAKFIFILSIINYWKETKAETAIIITLISSALMIAYKSYRVIPRSIHFHKVHNSVEELNGELLNRLKKLSIILIILYSITLGTEIYAFTKVHSSSVIETIPIYIGFVSSATSISFALLNMYCIKKLKVN